MKLLLATIAITVSLASVYAQKPNTSVDERVKQLHKLLDEQWEYTLRIGPEFASIIDHRGKVGHVHRNVGTEPYLLAVTGKQASYLRL